MAPLRSKLLVLEAAVCFGSLLPTLFVGLIFSPGFLAAAPFDLSSLGMLALVVGGVLGLFGIVTLVRKILGLPTRVSTPLILWFCLSSGLCASAGAAWFILDSDALLFTFGLPLLATLHFSWLGRSHLLHQGANKTMEPTR
jgi:hypothetical protein